MFKKSGEKRRKKEGGGEKIAKFPKLVSEGISFALNFDFMSVSAGSL